MIDILLKATILLLVVSAAAHLLRRRSAALRHLLWTLAIVGLVALPLLSAVAPFSLPILPARPAVSAAAVSREQTPPPVREKQPAVATNTIARSTPPELPATAAPQPLPWNRVLLAAWAAVMALLLARMALGYLAVRRIASRAVRVTDAGWRDLAERAARSLDLKSTVELRRSDDVAMPFACGLTEPLIVLPASSIGWTAQRREAVLMHELAHISRGDLAMNMLSYIVRAAYWFHPLAWLAAYRLRVEGERACDDAVLRAGARPSDYAEHLLSIVRSAGAPVPGVALAMARRSDFEGRLLAILEPGIPRGRLSRMRTAGMAALFLVVVMPLAAMTPGRPTAPVGAEESSANVESSPITVAPLAAGPASQVAPPASRSNAPSAQGTEQPRTAVAALIETLADANAAVRAAAVRSLGSLGDPRAIAALSKALREDSDARVREAAAHALGEIDDSRAVPALLDALKSERVTSVREQIVRALGEIDDPSAVAGIVAVTKDQNVDVRRAAAWALGELEDASAVSALIEMVRDVDAEVRRYVAHALGELENPVAIEPLMAMVRDADPEVRTHALSALGGFEDQRALPAMLTALKDPNAEVRQHAADAISNLELKTAPRPLIDALADTDRDVRQSVAQALGSIGDEAAVPGLKRLTGDSDTDVRRAAAEALSDIGGVEAVQALLGLLKDPDPEVRKVAAEALGKKRD